MRSNSNQAQQRSASSRRRDSASSSASNLKRKSSRSSREEQTSSNDSQEKVEEPPKKKRGRPRLKSNDKEDSESIKLPNEGKNLETKSEKKSLLTNKGETKDDPADEKDVMTEKIVLERKLKEEEKTPKKETDCEKVMNETDSEMVSGNKKAKELIKNRKETKRNLRITSGRRSREALARHSLLIEQSLAKADNEKSHSQNNDASGCEKSSNVEETLNLKQNETDPSDTLKNSDNVTETEKMKESDVPPLEDTKEKSKQNNLTEDKDIQQENFIKNSNKELLEINKVSSPDRSFICENEDLGSTLKEDINNIASHEKNPVCNKNESSEISDKKIEDAENVTEKANTCMKDKIEKESYHSSELPSTSLNECTDNVDVASISKSESKSKPETDELEDKNQKIESKLDSAFEDDQSSIEDSTLKSEGKNLLVDSNVCSPTSGNETSNRTSSRLMKPRQRGPYRPGIDFKVGSRLEACDFMEKWYPSKIVGVDWKEHEVLIHFERWSSRFDEWVSMDSPRLRAITRTSARKEYRQKLQQEFKVGDNVLAKWVDGKMYPAKVVIINNNGTCEVMFHDDGIQKLVKLAHIQKISKDDPLYQSPLPKSTNLPTTEKRSRSLETRSRSESKEKKANKNTPRKDSPSVVEESSANKTKGKNTEKSDKSSRTKQVLKSIKNEKSSSSYGFMMKRKKLLVGGIFQAKRTHTEVPASKKSIFIKRRQQQKDGQEESEPLKKSIQSKKAVEPVEENEKPLSVDNADTPSKDLVTQPSVSSEENTNTEESAKKRKPSGGTAPKEFIIEEDHNHFKCPIQECGKGFRKESLLASHMKHYHNKQNKKEPVHVKRKSDIDKQTTPKQQIESKVDEEMPKKTEEVLEKDTKIKEPDAETVVTPEPSSDDKAVIKDTENVPVRRGERQRKYSSITKELGGRRRKYLLNKNSTKETKTITPSQSKTSDQVSNIKRKTVSKDKNGSASNTKDIKGNFGYDCTVKDGSRKRKLLSDVDKNNRIDDIIKIEPPSQQEPVQDDAAASIEAVVKNEIDTNVAETGTSKLPHKVRKTGRKRHAGIGNKMVKEEAVSGDKLNTESGEPIYFYDDDNDEEDARNEVVNCICRFKEEEGLMMQCENCMAWQHGTCFNIEEEEKVPERYICFACRNPKAQRRGYKYWYEQGWWKTGEMATFNFLPKEEPNRSFQNSVLKSHALVSSIQAVNRVLHSLRCKLLIAENPEHPDLKHWKQPWTDISLSCETKPLSLYDQSNDSSQAQKELAYTDHSYSAVNRNNSHSALLMTSRMPIVDMVNNEMESFSVDMEDTKSGEPSHDVLIQRNVNDADLSLPSHEKDDFLYEPSVNMNLQEIKPDPESLMITDDKPEVIPSNKIITEATLEENDTKSFLEVTNGQSSNTFPDSKIDILNDCSSKSSVDDPILCQLNVLDHIEQMQEEIDRRLEEITHHVEALESEWEVNYPNQKTLSGTLSVKKMLKLLQNNLSKVQKMSLFS